MMKGGEVVVSVARGIRTLKGKENAQKRTGGAFGRRMRGMRKRERRSRKKKSDPSLNTTRSKEKKRKR